MNFSLTQLKEIFGPCEQLGEYGDKINNIAPLDIAKPGELSFLSNVKYKKQVDASKASVILLPKTYEGSPQPNQVFLMIESPSLALGRLCRIIEEELWPKPIPAIHSTALVDPSAKVSASAYIGPYCVVGKNAQIGDNTTLQSHVFIGNHVSIGNECLIRSHVSILDYTLIENRVKIHNGAVIGSDGYGYVFVNGQFEKLAHIGRVVLEDDVEIGANTTVDRARFKETRIGQGTKIDNLVQVAHNVQIGKNCLLVSQVGISGSTVLEDNVILAGQVGVAGHIRIGEGARAAGKAGVLDDVPPKGIVRGCPALPFQYESRLNVLYRHLPELYKRVKVLEKELSEKKAKTTNS